jgi:protein-tyrosine-phosphatase
MALLVRREEEDSMIVFVCEHGAAKSILAAAYFNKLAHAMGLDQRAVARGTNPDDELSLQTVLGLSNDGLQPTESKPQKLTAGDIQSAQHVIAFCELPVEYGQQSTVEHWEGIPPVSENYEQARDAIIGRIRQFLNG